MNSNENTSAADLAGALDRLERAVERLEKSGGDLFAPSRTATEDRARIDTLRRENAALRDMVGVANRKLGDVVGRLNTLLEE